jgi:DNA-binding CsgD family transcriptional regulator
MNRSVVVYGLLGGVLIALLKVIEYRYLVVEHSLELYGGLVAIVFAALGIWLGLRLTRDTRSLSRDEPPASPPVERSAIAATATPATATPAAATLPRHAVSVGADGAPPAEFVADRAGIEALKITKRELEILALMAEGLSNREIAGQIFVSENTVKTHTSRLFEKLQARRRTQAVQIGKQRGLIP